MTRYLWHRLLNLLRAEWHYLLAYFGIVRFTHMPTFVSVEPAGFCQLRCPECPVGTARRDNGQTATTKTLPLPLFRHILDELSPFVHTIQFYFQGEPLLCRDLPEMIRLAHAEGLYTIVSTNAQALTDERAEVLVQAGLSRIIVSMDGLTQSSYEAYRQGGDVRKVYAALRSLRQAKTKHRSRIRIELQCLRLRSNEHEWKEFKRLYRSLGADCLTFKTAQFYDYEKGNPLMPSDERYSRYEKQKDGLYRPKRSHRFTRLFTRPCSRLFTGCVIDAGGKVLPCCFDKARQHTFGQLTVNTSFRSIWTSAAAFRFRRSVLHHKSSVPICTNCTE